MIHWFSFLGYICYEITLKGKVSKTSIQGGYRPFSPILGRCIPFLVFSGGVQTIFKNFRGGQGLFIDSREGLEKIEKKGPKIGLNWAKNHHFLGGVNQIFRKFQGGSRICVSFLGGVWSIMTFFRGGIYTSPKFQGGSELRGLRPRF